MHRLHGCTYRLFVAYTVRHASTGTSMGCVIFFLTTCSSNTSQASIAEFVSACFKYQCSYLNILHASLLCSCLRQDKTCINASTDLYIPFTTLAIYRVIILLAYNLKILTGPITFCSGYGSWHQHQWGHKEACSTSIKGLKWGLGPADRACSKAADMRETCSCKQTSGLTLYRLLWPGRSSHGRLCLEEHTLQSSLRSYNELLYSHYIVLCCMWFTGLV